MGRGPGAGGGGRGQFKKRKGDWAGLDRAQELCEQGGGPGLSFPIPFFPTVPNKLYGFCGRKAPGKKKTRGQSPGAV